MFDTGAVTQKVIVLFFVMLCGVYARKKKFINAESTTALSALLVNITNPLLCVYSFQKEYTSELLKIGLTVLGMSVVIHLLLTVISFVIYRPIKDESKRRTLQFGTIYANCGFLGYPVLMALFGSMGDGNGLFYGAFFTLFFNAYCWTYGVLLMNDGKSLAPRELVKKVFLNPGIIGTLIGFILFLSPITFREGSIPYDSFKMVGDMTFPLSMFITGSLLSQIDFRGIFKDISIWYYSAIKLLVLPLATIFICKLINLPMLYAFIAVTMTAMPGASNTAIFADIYDKDRKTAAKCVGVSTFLSIITIPIMMFLMSIILGY